MWCYWEHLGEHPGNRKESLPLPNPKAEMMHVEKSHWPHENDGPKFPVTILKPRLIEGKATMGVYTMVPYVLLYTP